MAEIDIVRKSPNLWPWIVGIALIILAVAWMNWDRGSTGEAEARMVTLPAGEAPDVNRAAVAALPPPIASFVQFTESADRAAIGAGHEFVSTGITRLAAALDAVARNQAGEPALQQRLDAFHDQAKRLQADPGSLAHANIVRDVFVSAAEVMSSVQQSRLPDHGGARQAVGESRAAAEAMDAKVPLLEQRERVIAFFDHAASALRLLAATGRG